MNFEFDPEKSLSNKAKHGIDFEEAQVLWKDLNLAEIDVVELDDEVRLIFVGKKQKKHWTSVVTLREEKIRIISVRRSRQKEILIYESGRI